CRRRHPQRFVFIFQTIMPVDVNDGKQSKHPSTCCHSTFTCSHGINADMIPLSEEMLENNTMKKNRTSHRSELNLITSESQIIEFLCTLKLLEFRQRNYGVILVAQNVRRSSSEKAEIFCNLRTSK
ncbi:unnamed protein product, partial [Brassica oleracea]